ncbi:MAG: Smr/MutS family protein [Anaerolineae bacterium]|nr:Smr/MutS family protein [Anaerolineae bacterium]
MNAKSLHTLEFDKILQRLAERTSFSAGAQLARDMLPTDDLTLARHWLAETAEARRLLSEHSDVHLGGVFDVRVYLPQAERGAVLLPNELLEIRSTLQRARSLRNILVRVEGRYPVLADIAYRIEPVLHVADQIGQVLNDRGEVMDSASPKLARLRAEIKVVQSRLMDRLNRVISSPATAQYLQEAIITQRQGRYVVPLKAEFKGRIRGLIHDQSSSGATLFIEPFAVVEMNNEWRKLQLDEEEEVRRLLAELSDLVADEAPYIRQTVEALAVLDLIFARARYADDLRATEPELVEWKKAEKETRKQGNKEKEGKQGNADRAGSSGASLPVGHPGSTIDLKRARHPLLNPETVVPIDVYLEGSYFVLLVTGPNTGGKTVTLKTVGLLALMAQAGMHIPAGDGSQLSCFEGIFADIGDEQSIEQSLSTFSSHLTNIITILEEADDRSLVLLDELGAGTDPEEGSALARALLDHLVRRRITTLATTHYSELKIYAHGTPGVRNASVEFDVETLAPTFDLSIGLPGRSNALAIATRLGLRRDIIDAAQSLVRPESLEADELLQEIKDTRTRLREERAAVEKLRHDADIHEKALKKQLAEIDQTRRDLLNEAREEAQAELDELADEVQRVRRQLAGLITSSDAREEQRQVLHQAQQTIEARRAASEPLPQPEKPVQQPNATPIRIGDTVWVPSLQSAAQIVDLNPQEMEAELQIGAYRMRLPVNRLERRDVGDALPVGLSRPDRLPVAEPSRHTSIPIPTVGMEMDIRGATVEEMLPRLEKYLDDAYLGMMPWVRIIHGKGTGALRAAVRNEVRKHPLVKSYREGEPGEGGDGVTVVYLVGQES